MTAPTAPAAVRAIDAAMSAAGQLRDRVTAFVASTWDGMGAWRTADVDAFVDRVLPVVLAGQRQMAAITDAYLAQLATLLFGRGAPVGLAPELVSGEALRGVPPAEVYRRPGVTVWTELAAGKPLDAAVAAGRRRALNLVTTDLQLARTHTTRAVLSADQRVTGYRRTLSGSENCGICVVASTQRYRKRELMPIHPGCDCGVSPIYGRTDPGQVIDAGLLEEAHTAVADRLGESDRTAAGYRELILVREHGEIGPVLTVKGQEFTGPGDLNGRDVA